MDALQAGEQYGHGMWWTVVVDMGDQGHLCVWNGVLCQRGCESGSGLEQILKTLFYSVIT